MREFTYKDVKEFEFIEFEGTRTYQALLEELPDRDNQLIVTGI